MFDDVADPGRALQPLPPPEEFTDPIQLFNSIGDLLSPTVWVSEVLDLAFGFNPLEEATEAFAGDWESYVNSANAWLSLAGATDAIARNLQSGLRALDESWDGNASDGAYAHFQQLVNALDQQKVVLDSAHREFISAGRGVWQEGKAVADILKTIGDLALLAAVEIAAGTVLVETVVGPAILYSLAALEIVEMVRLWQTATSLISNLQIAVNASAGYVQQLLSDLGDVQRIPIPGGSYDHPAVA
ncbi:MAG: hypothetical protein LC799_16025 [Actinobacteria bacterium]|nr:hypothetical protein [Actinomycetota bacterium]